MNEGMEIIKAVQSIKPNSQFSVGETYETLVWLDKEQTKPTEQEFNDAVTAQNAEYVAQEYARNREAEYPTIVELTVALYDTDDKAALETKRAAVKTKWPKDNSGPV